MKLFLKTLLLSLLLMGFASTFNTTNAQQKGDNFGIRVMIGEPTGLSVKKITKR